MTSHKRGNNDAVCEENELLISIDTLLTNTFERRTDSQRYSLSLSLSLSLSHNLVIKGINYISLLSMAQASVMV